MRDFRNKMREKMALLRMDEGFAARYVNEGFSGGEKKRLEMLQMAVLEPEMAILDETDSGLDIDALRIVAEGVNAMLNPNLGVLLITHYQRLLNYIQPDFVHVLAQGRIVKSGGKDLALRLEDEGYGPILREAGLDDRLSPTRRSLVPKGPELEPSRRRPPASRATRRPMAIETTAGPTALDPRRAARRLPDPATQEIHGHPLVYLDSASTQPEAAASSSMPSPTTTASTTPTSIAGIYTIGEEATAAYEAARVKVARFINAPDSHEIVFTRNATEAINLVAYSWGRRNIGRGDQIVLTEMEHHANLVPVAAPRPGGRRRPRVHPDHRRRHPPPRRLRGAAPAQAQARGVHPGRNTLGTINPVREMVEMAHAAGALVLVDGAQAVPHVPVDVQALGCDFYAFSGHKMLAPMGSGALWARRELLEAMPPFLAGGEMIREVHLRRSDFNEIPWKFEAGTPAVGDAIGLGVAAEYLMGIGMDAVRAHERELVAYALEALPARGPGHRAVRAAGPGPARRRRAVQPAGHPSARRGPGPRPVRDRRPRRPPLHDAAPRAPRPGGHGPRVVQRLLDDRRHRRAGRRPAGGPAGLQRLARSLTAGARPTWSARGERPPGLERPLPVAPGRRTRSGSRPPEPPDRRVALEHADLDAGSGVAS